MPPTINEQIESKAKELMDIFEDYVHPDEGQQPETVRWWEGIAKYALAAEIKGKIDLLRIIQNIPGRNLYIFDESTRLKTQLSELEKGT